MLWYCLFSFIFNRLFLYSHIIQILFSVFFCTLMLHRRKKFHHHLHLIIFHLFSCVTSMFCVWVCVCMCVCIAANNNKRSLPIYSSHIHTQNIQTISVYCYHSMLCILSRRCRVLHRLLGEHFFLENEQGKRWNETRLCYFTRITMEECFVRYEFMSNISGCSSEELCNERYRYTPEFGWGGVLIRKIVRSVTWIGSCESRRILLKYRHASSTRTRTKYVWYNFCFS